MTRLPQFTPHLDERLSAEFLAHSLALLPIPVRQDMAMMSASALRFHRPEPPRDPDLPLLPSKVYPRPEASLIEATVRAMVPPGPVEGFAGRRTELDQCVISLLSGRPAIITGESGVGKTALLRQIAADTRIRKSFKRVWWLDDMQDAGAAIGLALNAPSVLRADPKDQPRLAREFLIAHGVLLLIDSAEDSEIARAMAFAPTVAVVMRSLETPVTATRIQLQGLTPELGGEMLARLSGQPQNVVQPLSVLADNRPRSIEIIAALIAEDGIVPQAIVELLQSAGEEKLAALYSASFEALPADYQALCRKLAVTPRRWVSVEAILGQFEKPLVGQRALTFLERRGFIERSENRIRTRGNWTDLVAPAPDSEEPEESESSGFTVIVRPVARFLARSGSDGSAQGATKHNQGIALLEEGKDAEAEAVLKEALALRQSGDTDHAVAETMAALARLAYLQGDDANAIRLLEGAAERLHSLRDDESLEIIRLALSRVYRRAGRLDAALSVLDDNAPPEDLIAVYRAREDWAAAIQVYERQPDDPVAALGIAEMQALAGNYADALNTLTGSDTFGAHWLRAMIYHMQGAVSKALDIYTRIRLDVPAEDRAPFARAFGRALASMGEVHDAALIVSAEGVWYEAKLPRPIFARQRQSQGLAALFNMMIGRPDEAEVAVVRARQTQGERPDPETDAILHRVMGWVHWQRGNVEQAIAEFEGELKVRGTLLHRDDHEMGVALHNIADIQRQHGEADRAIANYRRALTHKDVTRDPHSALLTRLALRDLLAEAGRADDALEAGQQAVELVTRRNDTDLQAVGYALAAQATSLQASGREPRAAQLLQDWLTRLAQRVNDGIEHPLWGVRALATGLYLRSLPETISASTIIPIDLAEEIVQTAEKQAPQSGVAQAARRDLADTYLRLGRWSESYTTFAPLLSNQSLTPLPITLLITHLGMARAAVQLEQLNEAVSHFDAALDFEQDAQARGMIVRETADLYRAAGDESRAAQRYVKALELLDREQSISLYVDTIVALAYARLRLRRFNDAIETFEQALALVEQLPDPDPALLSSVLADMATAHFTLGQYRRAAATYKRALGYIDMRREPERCVEILLAIAHCHVALEAYKPALEAFHDALQFDIVSPDQRRIILTEQAEIFVRIGLAQSAIDAYRAALALEGGTTVERAAVHRGLGTLYAQLDSHEQARTHFEAALAEVQDDQTGLTLRALADVYRAQRDVQPAITAYQKAADRLDRNTSAAELAAVHRALGELFLDAQRGDEALTELEQALELEKALPQQDGGRIVSTLQSLGKSHELLGDLELATRRHHEALVYQDVRYTPEGYVNTLATLGRLYMEQTRLDQAAKAYEEALGTEANQPSPDVDKVNDMTGALADVYRAQGRLEAAAKLYKQVMKVMQSQPQHSQQSKQQSKQPSKQPPQRQSTAPPHAPVYAVPEPLSTEPAAPEPAESLQTRVMQSLQVTETDIARHVQTLNAAEQSWVLLNRVAKPDLKGLAFVRALQAQTCAALGRMDESKQYLDKLMQLLRARRTEITLDDPRSIMRALAMMIQGQEDEDAGHANAAQQNYRHALDIAEHDAKSDAALVWAIRQKIGTTGRR